MMSVKSGTKLCVDSMKSVKNQVRNDYALDLGMQVSDKVDRKLHIYIMTEVKDKVRFFSILDQISRQVMEKLYEVR
jgi:hypothetical protein